MKAGKNSILITGLPIFSALAAMLPGLISKAPAQENGKIAVLTLLLSAAAGFYIRMNEETVLNKRYAKIIILISYLGSIGLLLFVPASYMYCFWMLGGLYLAMTIDSKLGLLLHFTLSFILVIARTLKPELVIQILILGILMYLLAGALKSKATVIYAIIIILSTNVTLSFVINNFIFSSKDNYNYLNSLFSILVVLVTAYFLTYLYEKMLPAADTDLQQGMQDQQVAHAQQIAQAQQVEQVQQEMQGQQLVHVQQLSQEQHVQEENQTQQSGHTQQEAYTQEKIQVQSVLQQELPVNNTETENSLGVYDSNASVNMLEQTNQKNDIFKDKSETKDNISSSNDIRRDLVMSQEIKEDQIKQGESAEAIEVITDEADLQTVIGTHSSYEILCSTENELLQRLKEFSLSLYAHSLHIADLSSRAAKEVGADDRLTMAGGLYHEIGKINGQNYIEEGLLIAEDYAFPKELRAILKEHNIKYDKPSSVEAAIVMLSDNVVSTIDYIRKTDDHKFTVEKIVDNIFQMRMEKGAFDKLNLSLKEFKLLKDFFSREFKQ